MLQVTALAPVLALLLSVPAAVAPKFPTACEVDSFVDGVPAMSVQERLAQSKDLLKRLSLAEDTEQFSLTEYFLERWAQAYGRTGDEVMLAAVDETPSDAGFANAVCVFYRRASHMRGFAERYRDVRRRWALTRCFSKQEIERLLLDRVDFGSQDDLRAAVHRVSGCDVERFLDAFATQKRSSRQGAAKNLIAATLAMERDGDASVAEYLLFRLVLRFRARPDDSILAAVDEAIGSGVTESVCRFFSSLDGDASFIRHYRQGGRRAILERCIGRGRIERKDVEAWLSPAGR